MTREGDWKLFEKFSNILIKPLGEGRGKGSNRARRELRTGKKKTALGLFTVEECRGGTWYRNKGGRGKERTEKSTDGKRRHWGF